MLKVFLFLYLCFCGVLKGVVAPSRVVQNENAYQVSVRNFEGRIEKLGFFASLSSHRKYCLYQKKQCIALLDSKEKVRMPQLLESFVGKNVIVKGMPQYVNKEPYLLIFVEDVCEL